MVSDGIDMSRIDIFGFSKQIFDQLPHNLMTISIIFLGTYQPTSTFTLFPIKRYLDFVDTPGGHMKLTEDVFVLVKWKIRRSSAGVKYRRQRGSNIRTAFSSPLSRAPRNMSKTCVVSGADKRDYSVWKERTHVEIFVHLENRTGAFHELRVP